MRKVGLEQFQTSLKLLVDDERTPEQVGKMTNDPIYDQPNWVVVKNYDEFVAYIKDNPLPKIISFDHDLGGDIDNKISSAGNAFEQQDAWDAYHTRKYRDKTGYDCLKWLVDYCYDAKEIFPRILLHTQNPVGYDNMLYYFRNALRNKMIRLR